MLWIRVTSPAKPRLCQKCEKGSLIRKIERAGATQNIVWTPLCSAFIVSTLRVTVSNATVACTQEVLFPSIKETGLWHKESAFGLDDAVSGKWMIYLSITVIIPRVVTAKPMHSVFTFYHVGYCVVLALGAWVECKENKTICDHVRIKTSYVSCKIFNMWCKTMVYELLIHPLFSFVSAMFHSTKIL